jgi:hypothetical protein
VKPVDRAFNSNPYTDGNDILITSSVLDTFIPFAVDDDLLVFGMVDNSLGIVEGSG